MRTLYLSDLDGTLLNSNQRLSEFTKATINNFVKSDGIFSYATARSLVSASIVTAGLSHDFPVVCYNGAFVFASQSRGILLSHHFARGDMMSIRQTFVQYGILPVVYAFIDGVEQFSFIDENISEGMRLFLDSRQGDPRRRQVRTVDQLYEGDIFYFACISDAATLAPANEAFKLARFNCLYQKDVYSNAIWLELLPKSATKATAAQELKKMLNCDKLVAFGDGLNDLPLFLAADECYAMTNATQELKDIATAVIDTNDNDGVARWILKNC